MSKLQWIEEYGIGNEFLDDQHRLIFKTIGDLEEQLNAEAHSEVCSEIISTMVEYSARHFKSEEAYMAQIGYPELEQHRQKHRDFIKKTMEFCRAAIHDTGDFSGQILVYLKEWWVHHILEEDMKYHDHNKQSGHSENNSLQSRCG